MRRMLTLLVVWVAVAQLPQLPTLLPVDEASSEHDLVKVRDRIIEGAKKRDSATVLAAASQNGVLETSELDHSESRRRLQQILSDPNQDVWGHLTATLSQGGAFTRSRGAVEGRREFCAPYMYAAFPQRVPPEVQGERYPWVITKRNVAIHAQPDASSRIVGRLSYAMIQGHNTLSPDPKDVSIRWQAIDLGVDREAFVRANQIWDPEGPHVCFAKENGQWVISAYRTIGLPHRN